MTYQAASREYCVSTARHRIYSAVGMSWRSISFVLPSPSIDMYEQLMSRVLELLIKNYRHNNHDFESVFDLHVEPPLSPRRISPYWLPNTCFLFMDMMLMADCWLLSLECFLELICFEKWNRWKFKLTTVRLCAESLLNKYMLSSICSFLAHIRPSHGIMVHRRWICI